MGPEGRAEMIRAATPCPAQPIIISLPVVVYIELGILDHALAPASTRVMHRSCEWDESRNRYRHGPPSYHYQESTPKKPKH